MMEAVREDAKPREVPKYGMWSNVCYMVRAAWRRAPSVLGLCLALAALAVLTNLVGLFVAPRVLGAIERGAGLWELLGTIAAFAGAGVALAAGTGYARNNTLFGRVAVRQVLIERVVAKVTRTSYPNLNDPAFKAQRDKASESLSNNSAPGEAIWRTLTELLQNCAGFVIYLTLLAPLEPLLVFATIAASAGAYFAARAAGNWEYKRREESAALDRRLYYVLGRATDRALSKDSRVFGMRPWFTGVYEAALRLYRDFYARAERMKLWGDLANVALSFLSGGLAYLYLLARAIRGELSASEFLLYFTAIGGFTAWVQGILTGLTDLHRQSLALSILREFVDWPEPFRFEGGEAVKPVRGGQYEFLLENVSFRYPGAEADTLHDVSLRIRPGEKLAVVGLNGAGKTTLVKLLCGFLDPTEGRVLMNGRDIREFDRTDYYRHFSAVFQDFSVMAASVMQNVSQVLGGEDNVRVQACLAEAGLSESIARLPRGADSLLVKEVYEDAVELSGGELQRLMLARALYKDAPILVLDEPTAALDPIAEKDIYESYNALTAGRTAIYISHRLSSTRFCDRILLLEGGGVAEEGTHESLLHQGGAYASLFEMQARYYREGGADHEAQQEA